MWLYWGVTANSVPLNVAVTFQDTWQKPTNITQTIIKIPLKAVLYHVNDTSSKRSSGWHFCFQGRFNGCRPLMAFQQCFSLQTRRPCHIPLIRVKGWHLSHPWILTAGTLSDSERRPLLTRGCGHTMTRLCASSSSLSSSESCSSLTYSLEMNQAQTIYLIKDYPAEMPLLNAPSLISLVREVGMLLFEEMLTNMKTIKELICSTPPPVAARQHQCF